MVHLVGSGDVWKLSGKFWRLIIKQQFLQISQVGNYIQPLWEEIKSINDSNPNELFNGGVEAATTLVGAGLAFILGFTKFNWSLLGEGTLAIISILDAAVLYLMANTTDIWTAYIMYLVFRSLYQMMITVAR